MAADDIVMTDPQDREGSSPHLAVPGSGAAVPASHSARHPWTVLLPNGRPAECHGAGRPAIEFGHFFAGSGVGFL